MSDTQLINSAGNGDLEGVKQALDKGAEVNGKEPQIGATALIAASIMGHTEIMKLLVEKEANVNAADNNAFTPLIYSAAKGNVEGIKLLLEHGANVDTRNANGETALIRAAGEGHADVVRILIEKGADIEAETSEGGNALILAADNGHTEVVKVLLEKGANKDHYHKYSPKVAYDYARRKGFHEIEELLKPKVEAAPEIKKPTKEISPTEQIMANVQLVNAIGNRNIKGVATAIENGADVNASVEDDYPIIKATYYGYAEIVELLIKQGANVNTEDSTGRRSITIACAAGFVDILKLLLNNNAEIKKVYMVANDEIMKMLEEAQKK
ncbi:ankyrin repeat domain-containing protein [Candidatus Micrarchaeota archaeon]|nr:ankyrin repeat domain-containing protein [Candidatus Micrarchaeota archaeon]